MHSASNLQPFLRDTETGKEWVISETGGAFRNVPLTVQHARTLILELAEFLAK